MDVKVITHSTMKKNPESYTLLQIALFYFFLKKKNKKIQNDLKIKVLNQIVHTFSYRNLTNFVSL